MLLEDLRRGMKPVMLIVVVAFVISLFLMYGRFRSEMDQGDAIVKVNGESISPRTFARSYQNALDRIRASTDQELTPEIQQYVQSQVLGELVSRELIRQQAEDASVHVTTEEVDAQVRDVMESFGSREAFLRYLSYQRLPYNEFEEDLARQLLVFKFTRLVKDGVSVTDAEVKQHWIEQNEEVKAQYLVLDPAGIAADLTVDPQKVNEYYQKYKEEFEKPEQVKVSYLLFKPDTYLDEITITDERIRNYYDTHPEEFEIEEERRASHILLRVPEAASEVQKQEVRARLEALQAELEAGADFAQLARTHSQDPGSAEQGGDLGYFSYETMAPAFSKAVFNLETVGEMSDIVETSYGFHLIKLTGIEPASTISFEEAEADIRETLRTETALNMARDAAQALADRIHEGDTTFAAYAREHSDQLNMTSYFSSYEPVEAIGWAPVFNRTAFSLEQNQVSNPVETPEGFALVHLLDKRPAHVPSLEEAREEVRAKVAQIDAQKMAQEKMQVVYRQAQAGDPLASFEGEWGIQVRQLDYVSRNDPIEGLSGQDRESFISALFAEQPEGLTPPLTLNSGLYLARIEDRRIPMDRFSEEEAYFRRQYFQQKQNRVFAALMQQAQKDAKIEDYSRSFLGGS